MPGAIITRLYVSNLVAILLLGVLASGWILFYTSWFEVVGGLLALGGVLSWLAFVSKVIPEDRLKELQQAADTRIFSNCKTWKVSLAICLVLGLLAACFGTTELETRSRAGDYLVRVHRPGVDPAPEQYVSVRAGSIDRSLHLAFGRTYYAHVRGYPVKEITLWPFHRESFVVPDSFARPVVLLRPDHDLVTGAIMSPKCLEVRLEAPSGESAQTFTMPFDGHAVWVGCDEDVDVPVAFHDQWLKELERKQLTMDIDNWVRPASLGRQSSAPTTQGNIPIQLQRGQIIRARFFKDKDKKELMAGPFTFVVKPLERWEDFPQVCDVTLSRTTQPTR